MDIGLLGELALTGALVGAMYGLVALGIVLIYKTSGTANFAQGAIAMMGAYVTWVFAAGIGLPMWLAIAAALIVMFGFGMLVERTMLRRMIGQPIIMVVMLTFGIELLLRGAVPGLLGSAVKRLSLGIPQAPVFLGDMLINRAYLIGGGVSAALIIAAIVLFNSRAGIIMRAVSDDQGRVLVGRHPGGARDCRGVGVRGDRRYGCRDSLGQHARRRLEPVVAPDEGARHRHPRRPRQHSGRADRRRHRRGLREPCDRHH